MFKDKFTVSDDFEDPKKIQDLFDGKTDPSDKFGHIIVYSDNRM
jgi:hypothetical protein